LIVGSAFGRTKEVRLQPDATTIRETR